MIVISSHSDLVFFFHKMAGRVNRYDVIITNKFLSIEAHGSNEVLMEKAVLPMATKDGFNSPYDVINYFLCYCVDFNVRFNLV